MIVPSFTFVSTANSVINVNANPIFADIEETTLGLDPDLLSEHITEKTKAVIPVDYGGLSCKIFDIIEKSKDNNLFVIEDAAESIGSKINNKQVQAKSLTEAVELMRGPVGTEIEITVRRRGVKKAIIFNITREIIKIESVKSKYID